MFARTTMKQYFAGAAAAVMMTAAFGSQAIAASSDAPWKIQEVSGEARFLDQEKGAQAASAGTILDAGDRVKTGADGRVVITRGEERITVSPSSEMGLPVENTGPYSTRILQNLGTILLKVQKQPNQHFEVQTPYMAAVVKGTTFTVSVGDKGAAVHVVEGAVQVADLAGQQVQLIRPGQTATRSSDSSAPVKVTGVGTAPAGKPDKAQVDSPAAKPDAKSGDAKAAPGSRGNAAAAAKGGPKGKGGPKIAKALGSLNLNVAVATNGLATGPGKSANASQGKSKSAARVGGNGFAPGKTAVPVNTLVAQATGNNGNGNANGNSGSSSNGNGTGGGNGGGNANGGGTGAGNGGGNGGGNGTGGGNGNANGGGNGGGNGTGGGNGNANGGGNGGGNGNGNANGN